MATPVHPEDPFTTGWREVRRKANKLTVCSSAIARVIGRAGQNINAIREATGYQSFIYFVKMTGMPKPIAIIFTHISVAGLLIWSLFVNIQIYCVLLLNLICML